MNEQSDKQFTGVPEFYKGWPERDIAGWQGKAEFALPRNEGGVWTGGKSFSMSWSHVDCKPLT